MADKELIVRVCHAYATSAQWSNANPVLMSGEMGVESDTQKYKIGDGVTKWSNLSYASGVSIDTTLNASSTNPVQNKVIKAELDKKMAKTDKIYEADLEWGGRDILDSFSPVDAAMVPELGSDHFCFFLPDNVDVEYSTDGGRTWLDYGATIDQKWKLFSLGADYAIGKCTSNNQSTDNLLRITMRAAGVIYTQIKKFIFYISTNGSHQSYVTVETQKDGSDFKAYGGKHYLEGWSGYSVVNFKIISEQSVTSDFRFGTTRYCNADTIRFTFGHEGFADNNPYKGLTVKRIMAFGGTCWTAPSNMATNGHLYSYNYLQESLFPATVSAPNFIGKVNGFDVNASVPANAKFTDTVYTHPATHPASMITGLSTVATSGSYNDLSDKPTIPTKVSALQNDAGYLTQHQSLAAYVKRSELKAVAKSGSYNDLTDTPVIPLVDDGLSSESTNAIQNRIVWALGQKFFNNLTALADVARTGSYSDLTGTPGNATATAAGLMSAADKSKLDGISSDAGNVKMIVYS